MVEFAALFFFVLLLGGWLLAMRRTISAALVYTVLCITVAAGLTEMLGRPKPFSMEWRAISTTDAEVLWYALHEPNDIAVLLDLDGPRLYVMPWNQERAEELASAGRESEGGGTIRMNLMFERSLAKDEALFYATPQPAPPPKPGS